MADRRIKDLTPQASLTADFVVAVDKAGQTEATSATITAIAALVAGVSGVIAGSAALTAETDATVSFSAAFASTSYSLVWSAYDASGNAVGVKISSRGTASFVATAAANCTLNYQAIAI